MNQDHEQNLNTAQNIVTEYGHLLAQLDSNSYAHPLSRLPYDKDEIKSAIHLLLWELHGQNQNISNSLAQSYVYLAQFIDDTEAETVSRGQAVLQSGFAWNEAYVLRAFLQYNPCFEIMLFNSMMGFEERAFLEQRMPRFLENTGGSLWLRKTKAQPGA